MNGFHEVRFPEKISYGAQGGPKYAVEITKTKAGYEQRNLNIPEGLCQYDVAHGVKKRQQYNELLAFFRARKGKLYGFRYKDWLDYKAFDQTIGIGDGSTTTFQLIKTYADDVGTDIRTINKPVPNTVIVYVNGILYSTDDWSCDYTTGLITFTTAPIKAAAITADFEFDVPVRFDIDQMAASYDDFQAINWKNISLVEVLL
jgi:uncharacterized protein (TIGR02217 family)